MHSKEELWNTIEEYAQQIGFDAVGCTGITISSPHKAAFNTWLTKGYYASMGYMRSPRDNPDSILPEAKSTISLAMNYY